MAPSIGRYATCTPSGRHSRAAAWTSARSAAEPGSYTASRFADPANTFHEKAALCRAAENTCYFATVNYASAGSPTTSAVVRPDGTLLGYQPYDEEGLLVADLDLATATCEPRTPLSRGRAVECRRLMVCVEK